MQNQLCTRNECVCVRVCVEGVAFYISSKEKLWSISNPESSNLDLCFIKQKLHKQEIISHLNILQVHNIQIGKNS